jgi:hypothetical protein
MIPSLSLVRRHPVMCLTGAALVAGAIIIAWVISQRQTLVPVSGAVSVDGRPVKSAFVTFYPNHSKGNTYLRGTGGKIKDGRYELCTYDERGVARKGIPPGWYRVVVEGFVASQKEAAKISISNQGLVTKDTIGGSGDQKGMVIDDFPTDPKGFFSNYNKPQAVEVTKAGPEDGHDLALRRPAPRRQRASRQ